jgi:hypothetical protein
MLNINKCINNTWCPGISSGCCNMTNSRLDCAGPVEYTNEKGIGSRSCCGNRLKCLDKTKTLSFCVDQHKSNGKCPKGATIHPDNIWPLGLNAQHLIPTPNALTSFSKYNDCNLCNKHPDNPISFVCKNCKCQANSSTKSYRCTSSASGPSHIQYNESVKEGRFTTMNECEQKCNKKENYSYYGI